MPEPAQPTPSAAERIARRRRFREQIERGSFGTATAEDVRERRAARLLDDLRPGALSAGGGGRRVG